MIRRAAAVAALALLLSACAGQSPPSAPARPPAGPRLGWTEEGRASWYGKPYHGRRTASGEVYDMDGLTAAHRTLSFGTRVKVTRLDNRRSVVVRITDRGPFVQGRIIDLSRAAARKLQMVHDGVARVRIEIVALPP